VGILTGSKYDARLTSGRLCRDSLGLSERPPVRTYRVHLRATLWSPTRNATNLLGVPQLVADRASVLRLDPRGHRVRAQLRGALGR